MCKCKRLQLLSVDCNITDVNNVMLCKSQTNKNSKVNLLNNIKIYQAMDYFISGTRKEAEIVVSAKISQEIFETFDNVF